jgi:Tfp pilus assembly protein PilO
MEYLGILPELPALFAVAFVCSAPWVSAVLFGRLVPLSVVTKLTTAAAEAAKLAADARVSAENDRDTWKATWKEERIRADSYAGVAAESVELGRATNHLLSQLPTLEETKGGGDSGGR